MLTDKDLESVLEAVKKENQEEALKALKQFKDKLHQPDLDTLLIHSVKQKNDKAVRNLIAAKANVNARLFEEVGFQTPLQEAADVGFVVGIEILLNAGAKIEERDNRKNTPLHSAIGNIHLDAVHALLERKADVNAKGEYGNTPLDRSVQNVNNPEVGAITLLLLERGAIRAFKETQDYIGYRVLSIYPIVKPCLTPENLQFLAAAFEFLFLNSQKDPDLFLANRKDLFNFANETFKKIDPVFCAHQRSKLLDGTPLQVHSTIEAALPGYIVAVHLSPRVPEEFLKNVLTEIENIVGMIPELSRAVRELCVAYLGFPTKAVHPISSVRSLHPQFSEATKIQMLQRLLGDTWDQKTSIEELLANKHQELLQTRLDSVLKLSAQAKAERGDQNDVPAAPTSMLTALRRACGTNPVGKEVENRKGKEGQANSTDARIGDKNKTRGKNS